MSQPFRESHSADVKLRLDCGEYGMLALSRVSPKSIVARTPRDIPPCDAVLIVSVDGDDLRRAVHLPLGFSKARGAALIRLLDDSPF
jgi:hypothetical protein